MCFFLFNQKTAYEMRISDWSSDVCSSDLESGGIAHGAIAASGMHLQRSATAGPPHDAYIPNQTILIVAQPARRIFIGNKPAVIVDYRISIDVKKRTSLTDLDIFVADTAKQCDIRGNRDSYIGAGIFGFITN